MNYWKFSARIVNAETGAEINEGATLEYSNSSVFTSGNALTPGGDVSFGTANSITAFYFRATTDDGYTFVKWSCYCAALASSKRTQEFTSNPTNSLSKWDLSSVAQTSTSKRVAATVTLYLKPPAETASDRTVSFNRNSADVSGDDIPPIVVSAGSAAILPDAKLWTYDGHAFAGWSTSQSGPAQYATGDSFTPSSDVTLYAVWSQSAGEGAKPGYSSSTQYSSDSSLVMQKMTCKSQYSFALSSNVTTATLAVSYATRNVAQTETKKYAYAKTNNPNPKITTVATSPQGAALTATAAVPTASSAQSAAPASVQFSVPAASANISYYYYRTGTNATTYTASITTHSTTLDADWTWSAPTLENYEFDGWYTLNASYSADSAVSVSNALFSTKVGDSQSILFSDLLAKLNWVCAQDVSSSTAESRAYLNYVQVRYRGVAVLVLLDATGGELDDFYRDLRYASPYGSLPTPTRNGYTFAGWYTAQSGGSPVSASTTVTTGSDHVLYAHWTDGGGDSATSYAITFNPNGGSCATASKSATAGSAVGTLPTPTKSDYAFDGWKDADGMAYTADSIMPASALTLYAQWTANPITISFNPNGGSCATASKSIRPNDPVGSLPTPTLADRSFAGWYTAKSGGAKVLPSTAFAANATLYAHWDAASVPLVVVRYKICLVLNGGTLAASYLCKYTLGVAKPLPTAALVSKADATFAGWYESADLAGSPTTQVPASARGTKTFYAKWTRKEQTT